MPRSLSARRAPLALAYLLTAGVALAQAPGAARPGLPDGTAGEPSAAELSAAAPRGGSSLTPAGAWAYGPSYALELVGDALVSGQGRVLRIQRSSGSGPTVEEVVMPGLVRDLVGSAVCVATSHATDPAARGLFVVRLGPGGAAIVGSLTGGTALAVGRGFALDGRSLYLARYDPSVASYVLSIVDVSQPEAPTVVGQVALGGVAQGISSFRETAYVAGGDAGVFVVDTTDPTAPALVRMLEAGGYARRVDVAYSPLERTSLLAVASGSYATSTGSVTTFWLGDPAAPTFDRQYATASVVEDVSWTRNPTSTTRLFAAASQGGVLAFQSDLAFLRS